MRFAEQCLRLAEARSLGVSFGPGAVELLLARVGANSRLIVEETRKLATYVQGDGVAAAVAVIEYGPPTGSPRRLYRPDSEVSAAKRAFVGA